MRPGRLDRILYVGAPDLATRKDIFRIRMASMAVEPGVDVDQLAQIVSILHYQFIRMTLTKGRRRDARAQKLHLSAKTPRWQP